MPGWKGGTAVWLISSYVRQGFQGRCSASMLCQRTAHGRHKSAPPATSSAAPTKAGIGPLPVFGKDDVVLLLEVDVVGVVGVDVLLALVVEVVEAVLWVVLEAAELVVLEAVVEEVLAEDPVTDGTAASSAVVPATHEKRLK